MQPVKTTIVSLMWGTAWERYGKRFAATLHAHWPRHIDLLVVSDRELPLPRGRVVPLSDVRGLAEFQDRWKDDRKANGFLPPPAKVDENGYSWRHDAVKWAPQGMAPEAVLPHVADGDLLVWLDADVVTFADVPVDLPERLLGGADVSFLGRAPKHSEIGYWSVRVLPKTRAFIAGMAGCYRSDAVFTEKQWHSAYIFDRERERARLSERDLTPGGRGHVWFQSDLGRYSDHLKGKRKDAGQSPERSAA